MKLYQFRVSFVSVYSWFQEFRRSLCLLQLLNLTIYTLIKNFLVMIIIFFLHTMGFANVDENFPFCWNIFLNRMKINCRIRLVYFQNKLAIFFRKLTLITYDLVWQANKNTYAFRMEAKGWMWSTTTKLKIMAHNSSFSTNKTNFLFSESWLFKLFVLKRYQQWDFPRQKRKFAVHLARREKILSITDVAIQKRRIGTSDT